MTPEQLAHLKMDVQLKAMIIAIQKSLELIFTEPANFVVSITVPTEGALAYCVASNLKDKDAMHTLMEGALAQSKSGAMIDSSDVKGTMQ